MQNEADVVFYSWSEFTTIQLKLAYFTSCSYILFNKTTWLRFNPGANILFSTVCKALKVNIKRIH